MDRAGAVCVRSAGGRPIKGHFLSIGNPATAADLWGNGLIVKQPTALSTLQGGGEALGRGADGIDRTSVVSSFWTRLYRLPLCRNLTLVGKSRGSIISITLLGENIT